MLFHLNLLWNIFANHFIFLFCLQCVWKKSALTNIKTTVTNLSVYNQLPEDNWNTVHISYVLQQWAMFNTTYVYQINHYCKPSENHFGIQYLFLYCPPLFSSLVNIFKGEGGEHMILFPTSLYLYIRMAMKQTVVIIEAYHFSQLHTKFYPTSCCHG